MKLFSILLIRILALYLVLQTLYSFLPVALSGNLKSLFTPELTVLIAATITLPIIVGLVLWRYAAFIADRIHPKEPLSLSINDHGIIRAGLFLIGITLFISHVGTLLNQYISFNEINIGSAFVVVVSLLLIFRSHLFINLYSRKQQ